MPSYRPNLSNYIKFGIYSLCIVAAFLLLLLIRIDAPVFEPTASTWHVQTGYNLSDEFRHGTRGFLSGKRIDLWTSMRRPTEEPGKLSSLPFKAPAVLSAYIAGFPDVGDNKIYLRDSETGKELFLYAKRRGSGWHDTRWELPTSWHGKTVTFNVVNNFYGWAGWLGVSSPRRVNWALTAYGDFKDWISSNWIRPSFVLFGLIGLWLMLKHNFKLLLLIAGILVAVLVIADYRENEILVHGHIDWEKTGSFQTDSRYRLARNHHLSETDQIHFFTSWNPHGDECRIVSPYFKTPKVLSIYLSGAVGWADNNIYLKDLSSQSIYELPTEQPDPRHNDDWVDVHWRLPSKWQGREVRLIAENSRTGYKGRLGISTPRKVNWPFVMLSRVDYHLYFRPLVLFVAIFVIYALFRIANSKRGAYVLVAALFGGIVVFCSQYYTNTPTADEWGMIQFVGRDAVLTWDSLWSPHNEHRIFIQRLIVAGMAPLTDWNIVYESLFSTTVVLVGVFIFLLMQYRRLSESSNTRHVELVIYGLILLHPIQTRTMIAPFQISWALVFLLYLLWPVFWQKGKPTWGSTIGLGLILVLLTGTSMHGLVGHVYVVSAFILTAIAKRKFNPSLLALSILSLILMTGYFIKLNFAPHESTVSVTADQFINLIKYMFMLSGPMYSAEDMHIAIIHTTVLLAMGTWVTFTSGRHHRSIEKLHCVYTHNPILFIGLGVVMLIAIGRAGFLDFQPRQALAARYGIVCVYFNLGLAVYLLNRGVTYRKHLSRALMVLLIAAVLSGYYMAERRERYYFEHLENARNCVVTRYPEVDRCDLESLFPDRECLKIALDKMYTEKLGFFATTTREIN